MMRWQRQRHESAVRAWRHPAATAGVGLALCLCWGLALVTAQGRPTGRGGAAGQTRPAPAPARPAPPVAAPSFFTSTLTADETRNKQAVLDTSLGQIVIDLLPDAAPNHVGLFITRARARAYDGTIFHRVIGMALIQGGDPLSTDPAQAARYGTGGLRQLRAEPNGEKHTRGAVSAVLIPGERDSAGAQFFICVTDQPALDGQYTVFGRVSEGIQVAQKISTVAATNSVPGERVVIRTVTIRDKPAPVPEPFSTEPAADLAAVRVRLETSAGDITLAMSPDKAPNHVRQFLRLASSGVYDGTAFHRVVAGFVIQGGYLPTRREPLDERQEQYVRPLQPEFNDTIHELGIVSMARGTDPASASDSFFIVLDKAPSLDRQYTAFGRVVEGLDVVRRIGASPVKGEEPVERIELKRAVVVR